MDFLNTLSTTNPTTWFLIGGIALLAVNIIYGWIRSARGSIKAGWFTVVLALVACILIGVGTVQAASAATTAARAAQFAGRGGTSGNQANSAAGPTSTADASGSIVRLSNRNGANGSTSAQAATPDGTSTTPQASGTPGRGGRGNRGQGTGGTGTGFGQSGGAAQSPSGNSGNTGGNTGGTGGFTGGQRTQNFAAGTQGATAGQSDQTALQIALVGGVICLVLALILYFRERRREGFSLANSRGLLNLGAAFFIVLAALVIPLIPAQNAAAAAAARAGGANNFRARAVTATPSSTPKPSATATEMPSLTPVPTDTAMPLPTQIHYSSTFTANSEKAVCTATANTTISLRPDPSVNQQAIGRLVGGTLLNVLERSADSQWLHVNTSDTGLEGWVSAGFVTLGSSCQTIPGSAGTTTTPAPATTSKTAPSLSPTSVQAVLVTATPCTLLTTTAASLRPDPSLTHAPLASIPARAALTPLARSANGSWWEVNYGSVQGWIGSGTVFVSSSCTGVPVATAQP